MKLFGLFLWLFAILQVSAARSVTKRAILKDLSQGFCRSYKFAGMRCCIRPKKKKEKKKHGFSLRVAICAEASN
jgi:hypothetical protein